MAERHWGSLQRPQRRSGDGERRAQVRRCMREMAPTRATGAHQDHCRSRKRPRQVVAKVPAGPLPYFGGPCSEMLRSVAIRNCGSACPAVHGTSIPSVVARTYPFPRLTRQHWHANWYARAAWITCARGTPHHMNRRRRRSLGRFREAPRILVRSFAGVRRDGCVHQDDGHWMRPMNFTTVSCSPSPGELSQLRPHHCPAVSTMLRSNVMSRD